MNIPCYSDRKSTSANNHVFLTKQKKYMLVKAKGSPQGLADGSTDSAISHQPLFAEK